MNQKVHLTFLRTCPRGGANPLKCYLSRSPLVSIANSWQAGRSAQVTIVLSNVYVNRFICICAAVLSLKDTFIITHTHNYTDRRQFSKTCDITWSTKQCFPRTATPRSLSACRREDTGHCLVTFTTCEMLCLFVGFFLCRTNFTCVCIKKVVQFGFIRKYFTKF